MANGDDERQRQWELARSRTNEPPPEAQAEQAGQTAASMDTLERNRLAGAGVAENYAAGRQALPTFNQAASGALLREATAPKGTLASATLPGAGPLDVVAPGTPLMSTRGVDVPIGLGKTRTAFLPATTPEDLADIAITQKRGYLESQRQNLLARISAAPTKRDLASLEALQGDRAQSQTEQYHNAMLGARLSHEEYRRERDINVARDTDNALDAISQLTSDPGSRERKLELAGIIRAHPGALQSVAGRQAIHEESLYHSAHEDLINAAKSVGLSEEDFKKAYRPEIVIPGPRGHTDYKIKGRGVEEVKSFQTELKGLGLAPYHFENPEFEKEPSTPGWHQQTDKSGKPTGKVFYQFSVPEGKTKPPPPITLSSQQFNRLKSKYERVYGDLPATVGGQTEPPPAPETPGGGGGPQPDVTQEDYQSLQPGEAYWYGGKQYTKEETENE